MLSYIEKKFCSPNEKKAYFECFEKRRVLVERGVKLNDFSDP
jgi:hypothetical protein